MTSRPSLGELFGVTKPILAMLHLQGDSPQDVLDRAMRETEILVGNGVDGLIVEDYFGSRHDVEAVLAQLANDTPPVPYGVNVLDDGATSFALAEYYGARFVQMDSIAGHLPAAQDAQFASATEKVRHGSSLVLLGGVRFKYQKVQSGNPLAVDLRIAMRRCDAVVVTGDRTGQQTSLDKIRTFREVLGTDFPLVVGAGVTPKNCREQLEVADAAIVGSSLKETGEVAGEVSARAVADFMDEVRLLRGTP